MTAPDLWSQSSPPVLPATVRLVERGHLDVVHLSREDRLAIYAINQRRPDAFKVTEVPQGVRLSAGPYIGVFRLSTFTVQVTPKAEISARTVLYMLARTLGRQWSLPPVGLTLDQTDLQEELAALFVGTLRAELRRGLLRQSQSVQDDLPVLRGRLRVPAYLRRVDRSRLPVEYVDLTANRPVNRLFLLVLDRLSRRVGGSRLRQQVGELRVWLREAGVTPWPGTPHSWRPFTLNRLHRRYESPLTLARMLLEGWGSGPESGAVAGQAFAVNMDRLFEQFLTRVLTEDLLPGTGYVGQAQRSHAKREFLFEGAVQELLPDLSVLEGSQVRLIIDFKNKRPQGAHDGADLYQMYSYARHFHCDRVLLMYPGPVTVPTLTAAGGAPLTISAVGVHLQDDLPLHLPALHDQLRAHLRLQGLDL